MRAAYPIAGVCALVIALGGVASGQERCRDYADGKRLGNIDDKRLDEASGLAASELQPGVLWSHNDSGAGPELFALDESGDKLARFEVDGADAVDWEDIALGPCGDPDGWRDCLYVADTGDNEGERADQVVYRVAEPDVTDEAELTEPAEAMGVAFPDEDDVEALFIDEEGALWFVGKRDTKALLYHAGVFQADVTVDVELVAERKDIEFVTSADMTADGTRIVLRTDKKAWELFRSEGRDMRGAFLGEALEIELDKETQGEAVAYDPEGGGFYTTSEGSKAPIRWYRCKRFGESLSGKEDTGGVIADPGEPSDSGCAGAEGQALPIVMAGAAMIWIARRRWVPHGWGSWRAVENASRLTLAKTLLAAALDAAPGAHVIESEAILP